MTDEARRRAISNMHSINDLWRVVHELQHEVRLLRRLAEEHGLDPDELPEDG